jgi:hypothetical protein
MQYTYLLSIGCEVWTKFEKWKEAQRTYTFSKTVHAFISRIWNGNE